MSSKPTALHVVVNSNNAVLAVYEAPPANPKKPWIEARPKKGERVVEVMPTIAFKSIKSINDAIAAVKPHIASAKVVRKG